MVAKLVVANGGPHYYSAWLSTPPCCFGLWPEPPFFLTETYSPRPRPRPEGSGAAPNPTQHKRKTPSPSRITVRSGTASAAGEDELGQPSQAGQAEQALQPITTVDLTAEGSGTYQMDWTIYQANEKKYTLQNERIERLKQWILKTTNPHF